MVTVPAMDENPTTKDLSLVALREVFALNAQFVAIPKAMGERGRYLPRAE